MINRMLVVDDSATIQKVIKLAFMPYEISLSCAASFIEAVNLVDEIKPQVILADSNLPGVHGPKDFKNLSSQAHNVPVIVLTGSYESADEEAFRKEGLTHFLKKPFDVNEIVAAVNQAVGNQLVKKRATQLASPIASEAPGLQKDAGATAESVASTKVFDGLMAAMQKPANPIPKMETASHHPSMKLDHLVNPDKGKRAFEPAGAAAMTQSKSSDLPPPPVKGRMNPPMPLHDAAGYDHETDTFQQPSAARVKGVLEPLIRDELALMVRKTVEEYCQANFHTLAKEVIMAELRRLAEEKTRHLVDK
ncbi:MAG: response regulator [Oligoflexales bacterium]